MMPRLTVGRRPAVIVLLLIVVVVVVGIIALKSAVDDVFARVGNRDCIWRGEAHVWNEADQDGLRNDGEDPLANVRVYEDDVRNNYVKVASGVTDAARHAELSVFIAGCPETAFEVYADVPEGYCATTPARLSQRPYNFGLTVCAEANG